MLILLTLAYFLALTLFFTFTFNFIPAPWTIYKNIKKLKPGHYLIFNKQGLSIKKYWDIKISDQYIKEENEAVYQLQELVKDATRIRLIGDVPIGAFLSGGIDSSVVVANMAMSSSKPMK